MINRKYFFVCKIKLFNQNSLGQPENKLVDGIVDHESWFPSPEGAIDEIKDDLAEDWSTDRKNITMMSFNRV